MCTVAHSPRCPSPEKCTDGKAERHGDSRTRKRAPRCALEHTETCTHMHTTHRYRYHLQPGSETCALTHRPLPPHTGAGGRTLRQAPAGGLQGNSLASRGLGWRKGFPFFPPTYICLSILARTPSKKSYKTPLLRVPTSLHPQFPCAHPTPCVRIVQLSVLPHQTQSSLRVETMVLIPVSTWPSNMLSIHVD